MTKSAGSLSVASVVSLLLLLKTAIIAQAVDIPVPNGSFESPTNAFADPSMDSWQKAPEPAWYMGGGGFPWQQLMGQFLNTDPTNASHIDNMHGSQGAFIFALPDVAVFQDYDSIGGTNTTPTHEFNATFEAGQTYILTVGLIGGGGGMSNGVPFQISLYYRDASSNFHTLAATTITNTQSLFPTNTHFIDFSTSLPVRPGNPWVGAKIGIKLASVVGFNLMGGYWDVDHVRLQALPEPVLNQFGLANGKFQFVIQAPLGPVEILSTTDLSGANVNWTSLGFVTNTTGSVSFTDTNSPAGVRFYQARLF